MQVDQLNLILEKHMKWLKNGGGGERANLSRANLYGADLSRADLSRANLSGAKNFDRAKWLPDLYILKMQPAKTKLVAYKYLNSDFTSPYQDFKYEIGKSYTFDNCNTNELENCGAGGNVATLPWCKRDMSGSQIIVECSFLAGDICAIPFTTDGKFRVRKLKIERIYTEDKPTAAKRDSKGRFTK